MAVGSIKVGSNAYFSDIETATTNAVVAGIWESLSIDSTSGDGQWNSPHWVVSMYANEKKSTSVTFANSSPEDVTITLSATPISHDGGNLIFSFDRPTFVVPGKGKATVVFSFETSQSVTPGDYSTVITVER